MATFVAGPFDVWMDDTYADTDPHASVDADFNAGYALGVIGEQGVRQTLIYNGQEITGDNLGPGTVQDGVFQGMNMFIDFVLQEASLNIVHELIYPFTGTAGATQVNREGILPQVGQLWSSRARSILLEAKASTAHSGIYDGTPNADTPDILYGRTIVANGEQIQQTLGAQHHFIPVRLRVLPVTVSGTTQYWKRVKITPT